MKTHMWEGEEEDGKKQISRACERMEVASFRFRVCVGWCLVSTRDISFTSFLESARLSYKLLLVSFFFYVFGRVTFFIPCFYQIGYKQWALLFAWFFHKRVDLFLKRFAKNQYRKNPKDFESMNWNLASMKN